MRNVTIRQIRVFAAVARNLSFTRAARELHLTQPAVSQQVSLLEEAHLLGHRGLCQVQLPRGAREGEIAGHRREYPYLPDGNVAHT